MQFSSRELAMATFGVWGISCGMTLNTKQVVLRQQDWNVELTLCPKQCYQKTPAPLIHFDKGEMQERPCTDKWVQKPQVVKINIDSSSNFKSAPEAHVSRQPFAKQVRLYPMSEQCVF